MIDLATVLTQLHINIERYLTYYKVETIKHIIATDLGEMK